MVDRSQETLDVVLNALDDMKGVDVRSVDVRDKTSVTDMMVIGSGTSSRHVKSLADHVVSQARQAGIEVLGIEGENGAEWVLVDLGDVVVHIMMPEIRDFYQLEKLWSVGSGDS